VAADCATTWTGAQSEAAVKAAAAIDFPRGEFLLFKTLFGSRLTGLCLVAD